MTILNHALIFVCAILIVFLAIACGILVKRSNDLAATERYGQAGLELGRAVFVICLAALIAMIAVLLR
ncbi:hypothetical protein [Mesorhizobium sp. M2A.F.Ca.ET.039.01.1.1]|uniref:hypothetical protein n=1 Tax=Mesorhizobium sp. M2A.F.Ca.ET.039.01.1.1 TaxID=2496746 RepID=UPI000FCA4F5C|nr:hypothetical protein [Mesorhizobium sp. M2A.F.Ca.ET.039.01.1.1]RWX72547.1 hypothetical protein EOA24_00715 [Mesorhizobium sp. M2A.F.Ca.ET.039.01.1.1]